MTLTRRRPASSAATTTRERCSAIAPGPSGQVKLATCRPISTGCPLVGRLEGGVVVDDGKAGEGVARRAGGTVGAHARGDRRGAHLGLPGGPGGEGELDGQGHGDLRLGDE